MTAVRQWTLTLVLLSMAVIGCRKRTPVYEVTEASTAEPSELGERGHDGDPADAADAAPGGSILLRQELFFEKTPVGSERAVVLVPGWGGAGQRFPVLVALHGRGESVRGVNAGANGWLRDYKIDHSIARLRTPPLTSEDFVQFVDSDRLETMNAALERQAFRGVIVVCPWVPDLLAAERGGVDLAGGFAEFIVEQLLPRVVAETPALADAASTGIDGVSLGGRAALLVATKYPERFGALGTLQAAVRQGEAKAMAAALLAARQRSPSLKVRLLSSDADYFRLDIQALHTELDRSGFLHEHVVVRGPHDYPFNRGPGGIEMLLWHDRVLRGEPAD